MSTDISMVTLPLELVELILSELPKGSAAADRIRDHLNGMAEESKSEPVAFLAHRLTGNQAGKRFVTQPDSRYNPALYRGPYPVFERPD
ncbi:hypothetical protein E2H86_08960 [Pseudomonas putida]|uniref:hypothetical protein n=1 Tax=Pseudomonas putida TaxID=303 RepID=UPI00105A1919|nr:hypothetical protein [Pseudomonas putida]TDJ77302.1 hypothetical protein E2H86_08960 [Pseudomonas putida]